MACLSLRALVMCLSPGHTAPAPACCRGPRNQAQDPRSRGPLCPDRAMRGMAARGWAMGRRRDENATRRRHGSSRFRPHNVWMAPVGIFDSGVGGLSVAREIRRALPAEDLLYVADTAYCPYGDRPVDEVRERALAVGRHLEAAGAKAVIVACNTATGAALELLREAVRVPVIGLEPAVKTGVARTRNRRVGVMATAGTLRSDRFARLVRAHGDGVEVIAQPCPGLVDLIEQGELDGEVLSA